MAYSETKVVLGGIAHIPIIIGFFYLIRRQYSFGAMLRTNKNALSTITSKGGKASSTSEVKTKPAKATSEVKKKPHADVPVNML